LISIPRHSELKDPATNIGLTVSAAQKVDKAAMSLEGAVSIFVHKIERPADPAGQTARRLKIASKSGERADRSCCGATAPE
jgi:hypothetical protein